MKIEDREKVHYLANGKKLSSVENYPVKDMTILGAIAGVLENFEKSQESIKMG